MSASGSPPEMPDLGHLSHPRRLDAAAAEELLAGRDPAPDDPAGEQALARVLEAAGGPVSQQELAREAAYVAAFVLATSPACDRGVRRPRARPRSRRLAWLSLAVAAGIIAFGGTAFAGALPPRIQELAHLTFGAPAPDHDPPLPRITSSPSVHQGKRPTVPAERPSGKAHPHHTAPAAQNGRKATPPGQAKRVKATPPGQAKGVRVTPPGHGKGVKATPPGQAKRVKATPPGQANGVRATPPGHGKGVKTAPPGHGKGAKAAPPGQRKAKSNPHVGPARHAKTHPGHG